VDHIACNKCSYELRYQPASYDYCFENGARLYVIVGRAWCGACNEVVEAEHLHTLVEIEAELRAIDSFSRVVNSPDHSKASAEVRDQFLQRRNLAIRRKSSARCLHCGSTNITPWQPYQPFPHPGCGGELRLVESSREPNLKTVLCDVEGNRL